VLYTISNGKMKMNALETLDYISEVELWDGETIDGPKSIGIWPHSPSIDLID
jgi:hypothetical protein